MRKIAIIVFTGITFLLVNGCLKPAENISAPTYGMTGISAQFADESISVERFTTSQKPPFGDTIRIQFPKYYPQGSNNPIDISEMRMTATLPVNVSIHPKLTVMDLTKPNTIYVENSDGTVDKYVIVGEIIP